MKKRGFITIAIISGLMLAACSSQQSTPTPVPSSGATQALTPTTEPATPTQAPATPTEIPATPTPTEVPVPTTNLMPTPITSGTQKEIFLSNFAPMDQKGLYATQKISFRAEIWADNYLFKSRDAFFFVSGNYTKDFQLSKYSLSDLEQLSVLGGDDDSGSFSLDYYDDQYLIIHEKTDVDMVFIYDHDLSLIRDLVFSDFEFSRVLNYDNTGNSLLLESNDGIYEYDLKTGNIKELFLFSKLDLPDYTSSCGVYHMPSIDEVCIFVAYFMPEAAISSGWAEYKYNIVSGELTKLPNHPGLGDFDEANARYSFFEHFGERSAYSLLYGKPATVEILDKDLNVTMTLKMPDRKYQANYLAVDWENDVVLYYYTNESDEGRIVCYSIKTGALISDIKTEGNVIGFSKGMLFLSGTFEENGTTEDVTYVWDYME